MGDQLVEALAKVYISIVELAKELKHVTAFHAVRVPAIGIHAYLERLQRYFLCSDACFLISLVYIDRILQRHPKFSINNLSLHRVLATSLLVSAKFNDDTYYSNAYYAKVCGLTVRELNSLEAKFLMLIDWKLSVSPGEYDEYSKRAEKAFRVGELDWSGDPVAR